MKGYSGLEAQVQQMREKGRDDLVDAHAHSASNRAELDRSKQAGCFYCCEVFDPKQIENWVDDGQSALCPTCGMDSVIGDASGFPVTDKHFLKDMNKLWFL